MTFAWTDDSETELKKLHADGVSYTKIAENLGGGLTRSAIAGKISRLGLSRDREYQRVTSACNAKARRSASVVSAPKSKRQPSPAQQRFGCKGGEPKPPTFSAIRAVERSTGPEPLMIPLEHLSEHTCKWPIGTPGQEGFAFCGNRSAAGRPYCGFHCIAAFARPKKNATPRELIRSLRRYA